MKFNSYLPMLSLQVFAEGGAAAGAGDGGTAQGQGVTEAAALPQTKGVKNPLADVKYGIQEESAPAAEVQVETVAQPDRKAEFDKLMKGEYKDLFDAWAQDTVQKRLKGQKEIVDKYNSLLPTLETLAKNYGVDATDIEALNRAVEDDDKYLEAEALEEGKTVQQLREDRKKDRAIKQMERENSELKAQMDEVRRQENGKKLYDTWMQQAEETMKIYPSFQIETEMNNPQFVALLRSNIDVRTAYEVTHKDEIISGAMQFTAKTVESKLAKKIASNGARPTENGMSSGSAAVVKSDVSQLSKEDRAEIIRRVQRGEKIRF